MKKSLFILLLLISINGVADPLITLSGSGLSGFSGLKQHENRSPKNSEFQFNSAANLNVNLEYSENLSALIEFGLGSNSATRNAFAGFNQGVQLQSFVISYKYDEWNTVFQLGQLNVPFGQFSDNQTNNSQINSSFLYNDLGYAFLGGNLQEFGANGVLASYTDDCNSVDGYLFNGTRGDSNQEGGFGIALRGATNVVINTENFQNTTRVGLSYMGMNDRSDDADSGINANISALMGDMQTELFGITVGGYLATFILNDMNDKTKDKITGYMFFAEKQWQNLTFASRFSRMNPEGTNNKVSDAYTVPGIAMLPRNNLDVERYQFSLIVDIDENLKVHNEFFTDSYGDKKYNNIAAMSYASIQF